MAKEVRFNDFGLLIAYVLPGFTAILGISFLDGAVTDRPLLPGTDGPTIAGFLYSSVAAIAAGLTVSTVRWLLIDTLHHATGVRRPQWDFSALGNRVNAFEVLIDIHYKYYQFYSNSLMSLLWAYGAWRFTHDRAIGLIDAGCLLLALVFYLASRDTLQKYYERTGQLLSHESRGAKRQSEAPNKMPGRLR